MLPSIKGKGVDDAGTVTSISYALRAFGVFRGQMWEQVVASDMKLQ